MLGKTFSTDTFYKGLWKCMVRDFRTSLGPDFMQEEEVLINLGIPDFRLHKSRPYYLSPVYYFKARYQMESLFKRYT